MNLWLLRIPGLSAHRPMRWLMLALLVCCVGGVLAIDVFGSESDRWKGAVILLGFCVFFLWAFFLSTLLLMAIDTRQLRVPGILQQIMRSLLLYGLLSIVAPTALLGLLGHASLQVATLMALFSALGLALALMPRYLAVFSGLTPSLFNALWLRFQLPGFDDPRFASVAIPVVIALILVIGWRWRQLLRAGVNQPQGWSSAMVLQLRNGSWGQWSAIGENRQIRLRPDWLQAGVSLVGVGPDAPGKTLRVALGGWYVPQTMRSYAKQLGLILAIFTLPLLGFLMIVTLGRHDGTATLGHHDGQLSAVLEGGFIGALGAITVMAGPMICLFSLAWLGKRWQRTNAELPLLALLPGLGDSPRNKRELLRAGLGLPLVMHALPALLIVAAMLYWHNYAQPLSFLLLAQLITAAVTLATVLNLFSGRKLPHWATILVTGVAFVLNVLSALLPAVAWGRHPESWATMLLPPLGLAWLVLGAAMVWLGRRSWRGLMQRPHPFLPN